MPRLESVLREAEKSRDHIDPSTLSLPLGVREPSVSGTVFPPPDQRHGGLKV